MKRIQLTARFQLHPGGLETFEALSKRCVELVQEKDSGTTQYDWFFSEDKTQCVVQEMYVDSDAVLVHIATVGETLGELLKVADVELELYGEVSDDLREAVQDLPHRFYSFTVGI